jgi:hypothetical protein
MCLCIYTYIHVLIHIFKCIYILFEHYMYDYIYVCKLLVYKIDLVGEINQLDELDIKLNLWRNFII